MRCGVDTGGTFTDVVVIDDAGVVHIAKTPSTPSNPSQAVRIGLEELASGGLDFAGLRFFAHGTTVGTNALLQGDVPAVTLLITEGLSAIAEVGDQTRGYGSESVFDLHFERPQPLAPPSLIREVPERVDARGNIVRSLDISAADDLASEIAATEPAVIAVCLLFSFLAPEHEQRLAERLRLRMPSVPIVVSSAILPTIREEQRMVTTVANAALVPVMQHYLDDLEHHLRAELGISTPKLFVFQSNGGMAEFERVREVPVSTALSGPAAGVVGAAESCRVIGWTDVVSFDMGGTSCDVALVRDGRPSERPEITVAGRRIGLRSLDIETISAGGGSIVWVDSVGNLKVGPESAGAAPGPAAYGQGGSRATVTDVDVVLGLIDTARPVGSVELSRDSAVECLQQTVSNLLGLGLLDTAWGVYRLINGRMADAIRIVSTNRGVDVTSHALCAFGGAGPLHAAAVAELVGIRTVVVPANAAVMAAQGLLMADVRRDYMLSRLVDVGQEGDSTVISDAFAILDGRADSELRDWEDAVAYRRERYLDMRYRGQGYEITVPLQVAHDETPDLPSTRRAFDTMHRIRFGHEAPDREVEIVTCRMSAIRPTDPLVVEGGCGPGPGTQPRHDSRRLVGWSGTSQEWPVIQRRELGAGIRLPGPGIVEEEGTSVVVPPGWDLECMALGHLVLHRVGGSSAD